MKKRLNIGILVSGSGTNLQSIIDNSEKGLLDADIKVVISNNPDAYALERSKKHHIPVVVIEQSNFKSREDFDRKMIEVFNSYSVELVVMAGFMRVLSPVFLEAFPMKVINIHPAILPSFPGLHGQQQAFEYGVKFSGCSVHFADEGVDTGPIIIQSVVPVYDDDTEESLSQRILKEEHKIFSQAIQLYAEGKLEVIGRKVRVKNHKQIDDSPLHNPPLTMF
ncbi:MAG: phosphoribosylglycinamide formyltransferase [Syntrophales bacterium]|nr:phosphoribosylglycinamide formyltransferase [Syntrophales bacterium]